MDVKSDLYVCATVVGTYTYQVNILYNTKQ